MSMRVLMCGSTLSTKGGMVSVVKNYLNFEGWDTYSLKYIPTHFDTNKLLLMAFFLVQYMRIVILLLFGGYSVVHLHTAERGSFWRKALIAKTAKLLGVKVVMHHHAAEFDEFYSSSSSKSKAMINGILRLVDVNIVLSQGLVEMIKSKEPEACVKVLYNAVNTYPSNPYSLSARNVLFLGRLGQRKGTFDLLEAISQIDQMIPSDVKFYFCGDVGEELVRKRVEELSIAHRIAYVGWISGPQKKEFLANTMINCLPSYNEGLPMTILETMAAGIPNISTEIASIPEVIKDGENGFLITPGDISALSDCLMRLIESDDIRMSFSKESFNLIREKFSIDSNIQELKKIYASLA